MADAGLSAHEQMQRMRAALVAEMPTITAADPKGNRRMVIGALSILAPHTPLRRKMARCGRRNETNDSREFCQRPACAVCMEARADWLFTNRLWPALQAVPTSRLRWVTILMFRHRSLDDGATEMDRQHRRLRYVLGKFAGGDGKARVAKVRVWGAREVERTERGWLFHVHLIVDLAGADPRNLAKLLRAAWGTGSRQVQVKGMRQRDHEANIRNLARYMCKARYTHGAEGERVWLSIEDIAALALWRDRQPPQWHRFTWGVRGV